MLWRVVWLLLLLPMAGHGWTVTLAWDYDTQGNPLEDFQEYVLERRAFRDGPWAEHLRFPAAEGPFVRQQQAVAVAVLPAFFRLSMFGLDRQSQPPSLRLSDPSNDLYVPVSSAALPFDPLSPVVLREVSHLPTQATLGWDFPTLPTVLTTMLPSTALRVVSVDSEEMAGYPARYAVDGDPQTFWHTAWRVQPPPKHPHTLTVDLGAPYVVSGLRLVPRQDGTRNADVGDFEVWFSTDGATWPSPPVQGTFPGSPDPQLARFPAQTARYVRLVTLNAPRGDPYTSIAEFQVLHERAPIAVRDYRKVFLEMQCRDCGAWQPLQSFAAVAGGKLVVTRKVPVDVPRCFRVTVSALDRAVKPPVEVRSAPSNAVCVTP